VFLIDLEMQNASDVPRVVAASCRITNERADKEKLDFDADGVADTNAVIRIQSIRAPGKVIVGGKVLLPQDYEAGNGTLVIRFENAVSPLRVEVSFAQ